MKQVFLNTDGGSRGNPGHAGIGFVLYDESGVEICAGGDYIGTATNNIAEYSAMVWGLQNAINAGATHVVAKADSELMVKQLNGIYRVKNEGLKPYFADVRALATKFDNVEFVHVYRESNKKADEMANLAMDAKGSCGNALLAWETSTLFQFWNFSTSPWSPNLHVAKKIKPMYIEKPAANCKRASNFLVKV